VTVNLSANESPLGPSAKVLEAIAARLKELNRYPDNDGVELKTILARRLAVRLENIVLGNGSSEVLDLAARAYLRAGDEAVVGWPSFIPYRSVVERVHAVKVIVPLKDYTYDLDAMARRIGARTKLVIIGNPNNPTGTTVGREELDRFLGQVPPQVLVVLDEAYREYVQRTDFPDSLGYVAQGRQVVVLRSLSKAYGLAGLRIGCGIAPPEVIQRLEAVRQHYNTNLLAQAAAAVAIEDDEFLRRSVNLNLEGMSYLRQQFDALGLDHVPSDANFVLVKVGDGESVHRRLGESGIMVHPMARFDLPEFIRVTVGLAEENGRFIAALRSILAEGSA
jgi:histidinol-phosphate aminotransferase